MTGRSSPGGLAAGRHDHAPFGTSETNTHFDSPGHPASKPIPIPHFPPPPG